MDFYLSNKNKQLKEVKTALQKSLHFSAEESALSRRELQTIPQKSLHFSTA